jgi:two-component system, chemotaxis family, chemotaxis protein CheY
MRLEGIVDMTTCLLVDDESKESRSLQQLLGALGVDTAQASRTDEALKFCNDNPPDVVMVAASGAGERPRDFVRRLRRKVNGKKPVVFLFAETADTEVVGQSIMQGAADILMQPFDRELLSFKLRQAGILA